MPLIKPAAAKALRQAKKRTIKNNRMRDNLKYLSDQIRKATDSKDVAKAKELVAKFIQAVDKAAQAHVLKKNAASRKKSRTMKKINKLK